MKKAFVHSLIVLIWAIPVAADAKSRLDGSVRNRDQTIRHASRPPPGRPPSARPPVLRPPIGRPPYRPSVGAAIRHEIREARRDRFRFLVGAAVIGAILREPPPNHVTVVVQNTTYFVANGTYYVRSGSQYVVVAAPRGAVITTIPSSALIIRVNSNPYRYFNGVFYLPAGGSYRVVPPPVGAVVPVLPDGAVVQGDHVVYGDGHYREVISDGEVAYQVIERP